MAKKARKKPEPLTLAAQLRKVARELNKLARMLEAEQEAVGTDIGATVEFDRFAGIEPISQTELAELVEELRMRKASGAL